MAGLGRGSGASERGSSPWQGLASDTVVVIGVHRAELDFGDRVAALVDPRSVDVLRIPHGIAQPKRAPATRFHSHTQHHEIYLQLLQQVRGRYRLMIDVHAGVDDQGVSADVFCRDEAFLERLGARRRNAPGLRRTRLVRIVSDEERGAYAVAASVADAEAGTWIPSNVWLGDAPLYVGLEVYLPSDAERRDAAAAFARAVIEEIRVT